MKIVINSKSSGKFRKEVINNRPHLVTEMISIEAGSVMNGLLYPVDAVTASYNQLDSLPAPAGHPTIAGQNVSAFHPLATNAHNIGAMVRNPRMVGNQVINELVVDIEVAQKDERGTDLVNRIEKGEAVGVSTGLNASVTKTNGAAGGRDYTGVTSDIKFDHVAVLLDEQPAGESTYTINSADDLMICNAIDSANELRQKLRKAVDEKFGAPDRCAWIEDILIIESKVLVECEAGGKYNYVLVPYGFDDNNEIIFTGEGVTVERKVSFEPVGSSANIINRGVEKVDKTLLVMSIIANSANRYTMADKDRLSAMSEEALVNAMHDGAVPTIEAAQTVIEGAGLTVNSADFDKEGYADFIANKDSYAEFKASKDSARAEKVKVILANSKMTEANVNAMSDDGIENLHNSLTPAQDYSVQGQTINNNDRQSSGAIELHEDA